MKNLIYKELKLVIPLAICLFTLLTALLIIPNYPSFVGMLYFFFPIQIIFQLARANKDLEFTSMLPVTRNGLVLSRHFSIALLQILQIIVAIPFAIISSLVVNKAGNDISLDPNFAFFGLTLISYAAFNIVFLPNFYKSGYKLGMPILLGALMYILVVCSGEVLIGFIPLLKTNLDSLEKSTLIYQILFLIAGIIIYLIGFICSYKLSIKRFKQVNL